MKCLRRADLIPGCDNEVHRSEGRMAHAAAQRCSRSPKVWQPVRIGRLARFGVDAPGGRLVQRRRDLPRRQHGHIEAGAGHTLAAAASSTTAPEQSPATHLSALTRSEYRVAQLVAEGCSNRQIADRLVVSPRTVETHMRAIYRKLAVTTRVQLARVVLDTLHRPGRYAS